MSEALLLELGQQGLIVALIVAAPLLLVSLVVGIAVSLVQVATSIQDATLSFVPKMVAVGVVLVLAAHWMTRTLVEFTQRLLNGLPGMLQ
jgi:flagellar biosynthetic protein FliQ